MSYLIASLTALLISVIVNFAQGSEISYQETRIKSYKGRIYRLDRALARHRAENTVEGLFGGSIDGLSAAEEETM